MAYEEEMDIRQIDLTLHMYYYPASTINRLDRFPASCAFRNAHTASTQALQ